MKRSVVWHMPMKVREQLNLTVDQEIINLISHNVHSLVWWSRNNIGNMMVSALRESIEQQNE